MPQNEIAWHSLSVSIHISLDAVPPIGLYHLLFVEFVELYKNTIILTGNLFLTQAKLIVRLKLHFLTEHVGSQAIFPGINFIL
jgi:hypothetical protein